MEFWWWIEPLFQTGLIGLVLLYTTGTITDWDDKYGWIYFALFFPFGLAVVSGVVWMLVYVFWFIWHPYF